MKTRRQYVAAALLAIAAAGSIPALAQPASAEQAGAPFTHGTGHAAPAAPSVQPSGMPVAAYSQPALAVPAINPQARAAWVAECGRRLAGPDLSRWESKRDRRAADQRSRDACESYLDDYYAYHARAAQQYSQHYGHQYGQAYAVPIAATGGAGCCQVAPLTAKPRGEPVCTETVEYVEVPVRPRARRVVPDKRIRVVPDKRVRVQ